MVKLAAVLKNSTDVSPDLDVRLKVEESQKELESYITRAEQLLGQRESQSRLISKYKVGLFQPSNVGYSLLATTSFEMKIFPSCNYNKVIVTFKSFSVLYTVPQRLLKINIRMKIFFFNSNFIVDLPNGLSCIV